MKWEEPSAESRCLRGSWELWRKEAPLGVRLGAHVLLIEALPRVGVRPVPAPGALPSEASGSRVIWECRPKIGGKLHRRLNTGTRPIENKYREGKLKRTLKREFKST